ncbi:hypothetical protein IE81DRAFT_322897 [Ceraceosorus guamensis]|uniref:Uncharacterized protein n=1 Tax=Ceraceosorus guamensis TaxID=1522189 RepID=A0A316VZK6_9BASI|nr:hypothetical protein IE81DRAFT_322897 [Ceraceosorus guamensis]PWN42970.1 hypothetical protein IE81DRAFT_322897 [Ceraceosorus guamensis]
MEQVYWSLAAPPLRFVILKGFSLKGGGGDPDSVSLLLLARVGVRTPGKLLPDPEFSGEPELLFVGLCIVVGLRSWAANPLRRFGETGRTSFEGLEEALMVVLWERGLGTFSFIRTWEGDAVITQSSFEGIFLTSGRGSDAESGELTVLPRELRGVAMVPVLAIASIFGGLAG